MMSILSDHSPFIRGRIVAYDALRVFAILTVVAIHTLMPYRELLPETSPVRVLDDVLHYAVPLFVFISGALVWARPWRAEKGAYRAFLARRLGVIGVPYLAWAGLYAALYVARASDPSTALARVPGLVANGHIWYHLYFIPMLLTFYLLTPVAARLAHKNPELLVAVTLVLRIVVGPLAIRAISDASPLAGQYATHVLSHLPNMALGAWFALRLDVMPSWVRRIWPAVLGAGLAGLTAISYYGLPDWPLQMHRLAFPTAMTATVLGLALAALALGPAYERFSATLTRMGSFAFGVYFVHPLVLAGVDAMLARGCMVRPWSRWWFPVLVWATASAVSFTVTELFSEHRKTAWLVGLRPPPTSARGDTHAA